MLNKAFSLLTETEQYKKFDAIVRKNTNNLLNAEQLKALVKEIHVDNQYIIAVYPIDRDRCEALLDDNVIHIFIPEHQFKNAGA